MTKTDIESNDFVGALKGPIRKYAENLLDSSTSLTAASRLEQFELDVRGYFIDLCRKNGAGDHDDDDDDAMATDDADPDPATFWRECMHLCQHVAHFCEVEKDARYEGLAATKIPIVLIDDAADMMSETAAESFWINGVEVAKDRIFSTVMWQSKAPCHIAFLRACNKFLKIFRGGEMAGRVLQVLANGFGIADKSGVKFWGVFRSGDSPPIATEDEFADKASGPSDSGYSLYQSFWSLQDSFSNPNAINIGDFLSKTRVVLSAIESRTQTKHIRRICGHQKVSTVQFLSSPSLFHIQLSEIEFRVTFLAQFIIIASHLGGESPMLAKQLENLQSRAKKLLKNDNPEYMELLDTMLLREEAWRKWKKGKREATRFSKQASAKEAAEGLDGAGTPNALPIGKKDITKMFEPIKMEDLASIARDMSGQIPTLDKHLEPYKEALDPSAGIDAEYHPKNNNAFCWRASRLLMTQHIPDFHLMKGPDFEDVVRYKCLKEGSPIPNGIETFKERRSMEQMIQDSLARSQAEREEMAKLERDKEKKAEEEKEKNKDKDKEQEKDKEKDAEDKSQDEVSSQPQEVGATPKNDNSKQLTSSQVKSQTEEVDVAPEKKRDDAKIESSETDGVNDAETKMDETAQTESSEKQKGVDDADEAANADSVAKETPDTLGKQEADPGSKPKAQDPKTTEPVDKATTTVTASSSPAAAAAAAIPTNVTNDADNSRDAKSKNPVADEETKNEKTAPSKEAESAPAPAQAASGDSANGTIDKNEPSASGDDNNARSNADEKGSENEAHSTSKGKAEPVQQEETKAGKRKDQDGEERASGSGPQKRARKEGPNTSTNQGGSRNHVQNERSQPEIGNQSQRNQPMRQGEYGNMHGPSRRRGRSQNHGDQGKRRNQRGQPPVAGARDGFSRGADGGGRGGGPGYGHGPGPGQNQMQMQSQGPTGGGFPRDMHVDRNAQGRRPRNEGEPRDHRGGDRRQQHSSGRNRGRRGGGGGGGGGENRGWRNDGGGGGGRGGRY